ncbi:MAG: hypothetical protein OQK75_02500 [Gammaproteobacteria bacterium]|nr:hypothetical protein [Gammaproteobacteria bacterium]MCW8986517.1 hypothetical protein [Gammaproteobacteria bacterium]MCW9032067.1 hypothetical protein [Gammaproteobacteria bacterium]
MKNGHITLEKTDGIYDINPLPVPDISGIEIFLIFLVVVAIVAGIIYFIWHIFFSVKGKVKRQVKQLNKDYIENKLNRRDASYKLCFLLQQGLNVTWIGSAIELPEKLQSHKQEWHQFADKLSLLRYSENEDHEQEISALFIKSLFWLRVWR